jgi:serine protease Do
MKRWSAAFVCLIVGASAGTFLVRPLLYGDQTATHGDKAAVVFPKELTSFHPVVQKVLPAVVSIESMAKPKVRTNRPAPRRQPQLDDSQVPEEFRKFFRRFGTEDFDYEAPTPSHSFGSGFLVDPKGAILTNYHVVDGADEVEVQLMDGSKYVTKDIHGDRKTDLAIVRIDAKGKTLPYLELGDSEGMHIGDRVLAVGAPFGLRGTVTAGIVSSKGRNGLNMNMYEDFIQTDAAINPGNSGGPLVNLEGKVIGINAAIKTRTGGFQGVGLAVASNLAKNVMKSLEKDGKVHRGYLGVQIKDLTADVAERLGVPGKKGVVVREVYEGSPASKAGLKSGDVITEVNGKAVQEGRVLQTIVAGLPLKRAVPVTVVRDGQSKSLHVTIEEQPDSFGTTTRPVQRSPRGDKEESFTLDKFGLELGDLTPERANELGYKGARKGAVILRVEPDGPAAAAGLRKGTLIVKVDKKPVASAAAARDAMKNGSLKKGVLLQVQTLEGGMDYVVLRAETVK